MAVDTGRTERPRDPQPPSSVPFDRESILGDYRMRVSQPAGEPARPREVLTGKAKFGIFGDGKEVPQVAMARAFRKGDFRSGYYRDQTFMMASAC